VRKFEPWKANLRAGLICTVLMLVTLLLIWEHSIPLFGGSIIAALFGGFAGLQFSILRRRQFGKSMEVQATERACTELQRAGFVTQTNKMVRGVGDIDIIAARNGKRATIEIKSFIVWQRFLLVFNGLRERKAVKQASRQRDAVRADVALIWLPQGRSEWWSVFFPFPRVGSDVRLVRGSPAKLVKALNTLL
jgi:Holliday junction resolvase-like predicted endonuclease